MKIRELRRLDSVIKFLKQIRASVLTRPLVLKVIFIGPDERLV